MIVEPKLWDIRVAVVGSEEADELLAAGYEPFAGYGVPQPTPLHLQGPSGSIVMVNVMMLRKELER